ncbi:MAG: hypothetical protein HY721_15530, partial [Planctomycetes bacterium]|nr:hypothetical protein [Planctomycetota bacterium]
RTSLDIDYHWDGDLETKRDEILGLLRKKLLPEVKRRMGYDGTAEPLVGPDADSPLVKAITFAAFRRDLPGSRIELPVDITRIVCLDPPVARTAGGTVYLTASDADMAESKVIALLQRVFVQDRDLLDLFLFQGALPPDVGPRLKEKLSTLSVAQRDVDERLASLRQNAGVHARGVDGIIRQQVDEPAAANLRKAGGGKAICETVLGILEDVVARARG